MNLKTKFIAGFGALLIAAGAASADPSGTIWNSVAICSPWTPTYCIQPDTNGAIPVTGSFSVSSATLVAGTSGGWTMHTAVSAASNNATNLKASAGQVGGIQIFNLNAAPAYFKFYNKASSPNPAADTPVKSILVPGASSAGAGTIVANNIGLEFTTGISYAVVTGIAVNNNTGVAASEVLINVDWK